MDQWLASHNGLEAAEMSAFPGREEQLLKSATWISRCRSRTIQTLMIEIYQSMGGQTWHDEQFNLQTQQELKSAQSRLFCGFTWVISELLLHWITWTFVYFLGSKEPRTDYLCIDAWMAFATGGWSQDLWEGRHWIYLTLWPKGQLNWTTLNVE